MTYLTVLGIYAAILFVAFFVSRRAIGLPILGLAAGALIAKLWTGDLTPIVASAGFIIKSPPLTSIVAVTLTFLPAILLLLRSAKTSGKLRIAMNSLVFALVGVALTYGAFSDAVVLDVASEEVVAQILPYSSIIITAGVSLALFDILSERKKRGPGRPKK